MNTLTKLLSVAAAILTATAAFAQVPGPQMPSYQDERPYQQAAYQARTTVPQQELDAILAPVALYPDSLLSQLLMAATYPRDVAEAARWSRANPALKGDDAVRAVESQQWDPSVKSMVAFPEVLAAMGDQPQWTQRLGEAFLAQEDAVMQTVQQLRRRADEAGTLQSSDRIAVQRSGDDYLLAPASAETVYVPYYDPRVAYGTWWWPDYQPIYWNAWPGYAYGGFGFGWGLGIALHRDFFYGGFNWRSRHVRYSGIRPYYFHGNNYWRGWRDDRRDGRRYTLARSPGTQTRYGGSTRSYNPSVRTAAPRYGVAPVQRATYVQRDVRVARPVPQTVVPNAGVQRTYVNRPTRQVPVAQPVQRAAQVATRAPQQQSQRSSDSGRGGGGRGRDR
jgi:hypothetical protein